MKHKYVHSIPHIHTWAHSKPGKLLECFPQMHKRSRDQTRNHDWKKKRNIVKIKYISFISNLIFFFCKSNFWSRKRKGILKASQFAAAALWNRWFYPNLMLWQNNLPVNKKAFVNSKSFTHPVLPNQFPMTATTHGQTADCSRPFSTHRTQYTYTL